MKYDKNYDCPDLHHQLTYPVGINMNKAKRVGKIMAEQLNQLYPDSNIVLICRGSSGSILSSIVATFCENVEKVLYIRKDNEQSHGSGVEHFSPCYRYVIVDDFIDSGRTLVAIWETLKEYNFPYVDGLIVTQEFTPDRGLLEDSDLYIKNIICQYTNERQLIN